jgi:RHS repeat-associated protein
LLLLGCFPALAIRPQPLETRVGGCDPFASGKSVVVAVQSPENAMGLRVFAYKSVSGRFKWLNQDPIGERGGINLYDYVLNNPINKVDPLGLQIPPQVITALDSPEAQELEEAIAADAEAAAAATEAEMQNLMQQARQLYPKLCNKVNQMHHPIPQYLGGPANQELVELEAPYHQLITNAFRNLAPYGQPIPDSQSVQNIVNQVYSQLPLPK